MAKRGKLKDVAASWEDPASLKVWPRNPRSHRLGEIVASIKRFGFGAPILARASTREVIAGHGRLEAAIELGLGRVPVRFLELTEGEAHALALADNQLGGEWTDELAAVLRELHEEDVGLAGLGWAEDELALLLEDSNGPKVEDPGAGEPPANPVSARGELYELGPHLLLCGDSTSADDVQRLMDGKRAALMATDPPYLVDYDDEKWDEFKGAESGVGFFESFLKIALAHALEESIAIYQWHASRRVELVMQAWERNALLPHQQIVWVKERAVLTRSHFMWQFEPCLYGWVQGKPPKRRPPPSERNVWSISQKDEQDGIHPTQKPLEVFARPIGWHTVPGEIVFEPFTGSGTQLVAAAQLGRVFRGLEIEPGYCDVIRKRWTAYAKKAGIEPGSGALE